MASLELSAVSSDAIDEKTEVVDSPAMLEVATEDATTLGTSQAGRLPEGADPVGATVLDEK